MYSTRLPVTKKLPPPYGLTNRDMPSYNYSYKRASQYPRYPGIGLGMTGKHRSFLSANNRPLPALTCAVPRSVFHSILIMSAVLSCKPADTSYSAAETPCIIPVQCSSKKSRLSFLHLPFIRHEFCRWHFRMQQASDQTAFHGGKSVQVVLAIVAAASVAVPGCTEAAALRPLKSINIHPYFDSL